jgi:hypothetical protein
MPERSPIRAGLGQEIPRRVYRDGDDDDHPIITPCVTNEDQKVIKRPRGDAISARPGRAPGLSRGTHHGPFGKMISLLKPIRQSISGCPNTREAVHLGPKMRRFEGKPHGTTQRSNRPNDPGCCSRPFCLPPRQPVAAGPGVGSPNVNLTLFDFEGTALPSIGIFQNPAGVCERSAPGSSPCVVG